MTWGAVASAAATVGGAVIGSKASGKAADAQANAAAASLAEQQRQFDLLRGDQQPYRDAGSAAISDLLGMRSESPRLDPKSVMSDPGYQFGLTQGRNALEGSAAAGGGLYSGAALKALTQYGNDYGTTKYNDAWNRQQNEFGNRWNRLAGLAGVGQTSVQNTGQAGQNFSNQYGNITMGNANNQGANSINQGNIWGNALNSLGSQFGRMTTGGGGITPTFNYDQGSDGAGGYYGHEGRGYADGGPVRSEPVVGTRAPQKQGGGGGGLSREAILAALNTVPVQPAASGVGALPANPVTNPGAILKDREKKATGYSKGGKVKGPGGPRDDKIIARLSNGEHVMDAESVNAIGGGDNELGQAKLNALRQLVKGC